MDALARGGARGARQVRRRDPSGLGRAVDAAALQEALDRAEQRPRVGRHRVGLGQLVGARRARRPPRPRAARRPGRRRCRAACRRSRACARADGPRRGARPRRAIAGSSCGPRGRSRSRPGPAGKHVPDARRAQLHPRDRLEVAGDQREQHVVARGQRLQQLGTPGATRPAGVGHPLGRTPRPPPLQSRRMPRRRSRRGCPPAARCGGRSRGRSGPPPRTFAGCVSRDPLQRGVHGLDVLAGSLAASECRLCRTTAASPPSLSWT